MPHALKDTSLKLTKACPADTNAVTSSAIDSRNSSRGDFVADHSMLLSAPALNATQLPNTTTLTYDIVDSPNSDLSGPTTIVSQAIVQTGSGGAAAATKRFKLPSGVQRYVGFKMTGANVGNASFGNCAAVNATLEMLF